MCRVKNNKNYAKRLPKVKNRIYIYIIENPFEP